MTRTCPTMSSGACAGAGSSFTCRASGGAWKRCRSVSRIAALLAVAAFGALLTGVFQTALDRKLNDFGVLPAERVHVEAQRSRLAGAETDDPLARQAINEAFVDGYRAVLWVAVGLALASSLSAFLLIRAETKRAR